MAEKKIVGWFYRNGKRIPIFEKNIHRGKTTQYEVVQTGDMAGRPIKKRAQRPIDGQKFNQAYSQASAKKSIRGLRDAELFGVRGSYDIREKKIVRGKKKK
jgi:hypothetical protein